MATEIEALMRIQRDLEEAREDLETQATLTTQYQTTLRSLFNKSFQQPLKSRYNEAALHVLLSSLDSIDGLLNDGAVHDVPAHAFLVQHLLKVFVDPYGSKHISAAINCYCGIIRHLRRFPALLNELVQFHLTLIPFLGDLLSNPNVAYPCQIRIHPSVDDFLTIDNTASLERLLTTILTVLQTCMGLLGATHLEELQMIHQGCVRVAELPCTLTSALYETIFDYTAALLPWLTPASAHASGTVICSKFLTARWLANPGLDLKAATRMVMSLHKLRGGWNALLRVLSRLLESESSCLKSWALSTLATVVTWEGSRPPTATIAAMARALLDVHFGVVAVSSPDTLPSGVFEILISFERGLQPGDQDLWHLILQSNTQGSPSAKRAKSKETSGMDTDTDRPLCLLGYALDRLQDSLTHVQVDRSTPQLLHRAIRLQVVFLKLFIASDKDLDLPSGFWERFFVKPAQTSVQLLTDYNTHLLPLLLDLFHACFLVQALACTFKLPRVVDELATTIAILPWLCDQDLSAAQHAACTRPQQIVSELASFQAVQATWRQAWSALQTSHTEKILFFTFGAAACFAQRNNPLAQGLLQNFLSHKDPQLVTMALRLLPFVLANSTKSGSALPFQPYASILANLTQDPKLTIARANAVCGLSTVFAGECVCYWQLLDPDNSGDYTIVSGDECLRLAAPSSSSTLLFHCRSKPFNQRDKSLSDLFAPLSIVNPTSDRATKLAVLEAVACLATRGHIYCGLSGQTVDFKWVVGFVLDSDLVVRQATIDLLPHLCGPDGEHVDQVIQAIQTLQREQDDETNNTALAICGSLGKLVRTLCSQGAAAAAIVALVLFIPRHTSAMLHLMEAAALKGQKVSELVMPHVDAVTNAMLANKGVEPLHPQFYPVLFGVPTAQEFWSAQCKTALCYILRRRQASQLEQLSDLTGQPVSSMIETNAPGILSVLFLKSSGDELSAALSFLVDQAKRQVSLLVSCNVMRIATDLISSLKPDMDSVAAERFRRSIQLLAHYANTSDPRFAKVTDIDAKLLEEFFQGYITACLFHLRQQSLSSTVDGKQRALGGLMGLLAVAGPNNLASVRIQIIALLAHSLKTDALVQDAMKACTQFVQTVPTSALGNMLPKISVMLMPFISSHTSSVASILHYFIVDHRYDLEDYLKQVIFLPRLNYPELAAVNRVLNDQIYSKPRSDWKSNLEDLLPGLQHETVAVRTEATRNLLPALAENGKDISSALTSDSVGVPLIIKDVLQVLLQNCAADNEELQDLCAQCIGQLGAIDVGRLDGLHLPNVRQRTKISNFSLTTTEAGVDLIGGILSRLLLSAETHDSQDRAAAAIQECLNSYGCRAKSLTLDVNELEKAEQLQASRSSRSRVKLEVKDQLWLKFGADTREVVFPYLSSRFVIPDIFESGLDITLPFFPHHGRNVRAWAQCLIFFLTKTLKDDARRLSDGDEISEAELTILSTAAHCMRDSLDLAMYLLPHAVLLTLRFVNKASVLAGIQAELQLVLDAAVQCQANNEAISEDLHIAVDLVFGILDFVQRWIAACDKHLSAVSSKRVVRPGLARHEDSIQAASTFASRVPHDMAAKAAFACRDYSRALQQLEQYITQPESVDDTKDASRLKEVYQLQEVRLQENIQLIQQIYSQLSDIDGMVGVASRRHTTSIEDEVLDHRAAGHWTQALSCYEQVIASSDNDILAFQEGMLECQSNLGHLEIVMSNATGMLHRHPEWKTSLDSYRVEAAWKLCHWGELSSTIEEIGDASDTFDTQLGRAFNSAWHGKAADFAERLKVARLSVVTPLSTLVQARSSYSRMYEHVLKLHVLNEVQSLLEHVVDPEQFDANEALKSLSLVSKQWQHRSTLVNSSFTTKECLVSIRRSALDLFRSKFQRADGALVGQMITQCWHESAREARVAGLYDTAYTALLHAKQRDDKSVVVERARLAWATGNNHEALLQLQDDLRNEKLQPKTGDYQEAQLLIGEWMTETSRFSQQTVCEYFLALSKSASRWDKSHYAYASYLDDLVMKGHLDEQAQLQIIISEYGESLVHGYQYTYHALPRLLTLWFEYGSRLANIDNQKLQKAARARSETTPSANPDVLQAINGIMVHLNKRLHAYQFLTALPHLISRICHGNQEVFDALREILVRLLKAYPQQTLWQFMASSASTFGFRKTRTAETLDCVTGQEFGNLRATFDRLHKLMLHLCRHEINDISKTLDFSAHFKRLYQGDWRTIIVPSSSSMIPSLPSSSTHKRHNPFGDDLPTFSGFDRVIHVYHSKQRPRRININGSDGQSYTFMCKEDDDIRKDNRIMDFNAIVAKFLKADPDARQRQLTIRTYGVWPLNEKCGMIEWIHGLDTARNVIMSIYRAKKISLRGGQLKIMANPDTWGNKLSPLEIFETKLLPQHPPVLKEWFVHQFPDPTAWYLARTSFSRSNAVMSMVGHILGLGDRHFENIMLDTVSGAVIHVDFNCVFDKGKTLAVKERVPFRLTHNMVKAMGVTGYEGAFRRCCEVTMAVLRSERASLANVLETLIYDPLVEWDADRGQRKRSIALYMRSKDGTHHIDKVKRKLMGFSDNDQGLKRSPLSVEGQVHELISEAVSKENLCQMYIGWTPFM